MLNENLLNTGDIINTPSMTGSRYKNGQTFYAYGNNQNYSGSDASQYINPETIQAGLQLTTAVASGVSQNRASQGACKKPLIRENPLNRRKWSDYRACLDREERKRQMELEKARLEAEAKSKEAEASYNRRDGGSYDDGDDKILGMPKGLAIGIGVALGVAVLGLVAYKIVKAKKA